MGVWVYIVVVSTICALIFAGTALTIIGGLGYVVIEIIADLLLFKIEAAM
jgi:hypothetical protein